VSAGVATAVISAHGYEAGKTLLIAGATPSGLNGNRMVTAVVDSNTVQWSAAGVADGTASGAITARRAPLGWTKAHAGTNKAIYQRTDQQATSLLFRVDDTNTGVASSTYARAVMVESAGDIDTFYGVSPTPAQFSGGVYISKGPDNSIKKPWVIVGDGRTLWILTDDVNYAQQFYGGGLHPHVFGDLNSIRSNGDAYGCIIGGCNAPNGFTGVTYNDGNSVTNSIFIARPTNHIGSATRGLLYQRSNGYLGATGPVYPSPVDGGMMIDQSVLVREENSAMGFPIRGMYRGLAQPIANLGSALHGQVLSGLIGSSDSWLCMAVTSQGSSGAVLFNITSDWG